MAALRVPGVADMHGGHGAEVATYGPGRRVRGVRVRSHTGACALELHVIPELGPAGDAATPLNALAAAIDASIRERLGPEAPLTIIDITFEVGRRAGKGSA